MRQRLGQSPELCRMSSQAVVATGCRAAEPLIWAGREMAPG